VSPVLGGAKRPSARARGVSPVIATILLLSITIVLLATLYYFVKVPLSPPAPQIQLTSQYNFTNIVVYGEGNNPGSANCPGSPSVCNAKGSVFDISQVSGSVSLNLVQVQFFCDGSLALQGSLASIESPQTTTIGAHTLNTLCPSQSSGSGPTCINYPASSGASIGDIVYYVPLSTNAGGLQSGSQFVVYSSVCNTKIALTNGFYYGPPQECTVPASGCEIQLLYTGSPQAILATIPIIS
jgi:flagellin-like protein